jgi:cyclic beta-1,2-glucan synthetase
MLRVALESLLGFRVENGETLNLDPCVPDDWPGFRIEYRSPRDDTRYEITASNPRRRGLGVAAATLDGEPVVVEDGAARIPLAHDGGLHRVELVLGGKESA